jgi:nitrate/TMAO reductase-like tetraheme cytochrome c subunit
MGRIRASRVVYATLAQVNTEPTDAEVRACRISLGREAIDRLIESASCPNCHAIHYPEIASSFRLLQEGWNALTEDAKAARTALRKEREERNPK